MFEDGKMWLNENNALLFWNNRLQKEFKYTTKKKINQQYRETTIWITMQLISVFSPVCSFIKAPLWPCVTCSSGSNLVTVWSGRRCWVWLHKRQQGKNKWQTYSQGWKPYNKPHCLSALCHFPLQTSKRGEKKSSFCSFSFLPLTFPLNLQIHWLTSPPLFIPSSSSSCWLISSTNGTLFQLAPPASLSATNSKSLSFPLQFPNEFYWHGEKRSIHLPLHLLSVFLFWVHFRKLYWHHSMTITLSLPLSQSFLCVPLSCQFK